MIDKSVYLLVTHYISASQTSVCISNHPGILSNANSGSVGPEWGLSASNKLPSDAYAISSWLTLQVANDWAIFYFYILNIVCRIYSIF